MCLCVCVPSRLNESAGWYFQGYVCVRLFRRVSSSKRGGAKGTKAEGDTAAVSKAQV